MFETLHSVFSDVYISGIQLLMVLHCVTVGNWPEDGSHLSAHLNPGCCADDQL